MNRRLSCQKLASDALLKVTAMSSRISMLKRLADVYSENTICKKDVHLAVTAEVT
jgi:hypothetical protein